MYQGIAGYTGSVQAEAKTSKQKPIISDEQELEHNNRARSAKLRVAEILK